MKFLTSTLFLFCGLILSQILSVSALPIAQKEHLALEKRKIHPLDYLFTFVYFKKPDNWGNDVRAYIYEVGTEDKNWPGEYMRLRDDGYYQLTTSNQMFLKGKDYRIIFNDNKSKHQAPGVLQEGFPFRMDAVYDQNGILGYTDEKPSGITTEAVKKVQYSNFARIMYRPKEKFFGKDVYAHFKVGNGNWNEIPGEQLYYMTDGFYRITIYLHDAEDITIAFTDGKKWDNNDGKNYYFKKNDNYVIDKNGSYYSIYRY